MQDQANIGELYKQATEHHGAGRFGEAIALYEQILDERPRDANILHLMGLAHYQSGDPLTAEETMTLGLEVDTSNANHHSNYGAVLAALGRLGEAVEALKRATELDPKNPEALSNLSALLQQLGRLDEAQVAIECALENHPDDPSALNNLGSVLKDRGDFNGAEQAFRKALSINANLLEANINLTNLLLSVEKPDEALPFAEKAVAVAPGHAEAMNALGLVYQKSGQLDDAERVFSEAIKANPQHVLALNNFGAVLKQQGRIEEAARAFVDAHRAGGPSPEINTNLAEIMVLLDKASDALVTVEQAIIINPDYTRGWQVMGDILRKLGRLSEAIAAWEKVLSQDPQSAEAFFAIAATLAKAGDSQKALAYYDTAHQAAPDNAKIHSNLLMALHYAPGVDRQTIFDEHLAWARAHTDPAVSRPEIVDPSPERPLKIGFVSADFRFHAVAFFFLEVLKKWPQDDWDIHLYSSVANPDDYTKAFEEAADAWHDIGNLDDDEAAAQIKSDGIDILIDMAGHTKGNRLGVFALRPAPLQACWFDYVDTTGLKAMDYWIGDHHQSPESEDHYFSEKVIRLPDDYICYTPPASIPPLSKPAFKKNGHVILGCFNTAYKISTEAVAAWAEVLSQLPEAKILINTPELAMPYVQERYTTLFSKLGIENDRILYGTGGDHQTFLAQYGEIDIALDPFPYSGGLNTCEALLMGVPVVTFPGDRFCGRHATAHLTTAGHPELIAKNKADYVATVVDLANDTGRIAKYRKTLRDDLMSSPLTDAEKFAREFANTLRSLWTQACAN